MSLNIDIAPTLLDMAGISVPQEMNGQSLLPILKQKNFPGREAFLMKFWRYYPENTPSHIGVRTDRYKYVRFERGRSPWLFVMKNDPKEMNNLFGTEEGNSLLPELEQRLVQLMH